MKKVLFTILFFLFSVCLSVENPVLKSYKVYNKSSETVYLEAFSAISSSKFEILELQSQSGYIIFRFNKKEYLLTVVKDGGGSLVKIVPEDMDYASSLGVFDTIFKALDGAL